MLKLKKEKKQPAKKAEKKTEKKAAKPAEEPVKRAPEVKPEELTVRAVITRKMPLKGAPARSESLRLRRGRKR